MKCAYGCDLDAKFKLSNGKWCCSDHYNKCLAIRKRNSNGLKKAYKEGRKNVKHFDGKRGWSKGKILNNKEDIFKLDSTFSNEYVKSTILTLKLKEYKCSECNIDIWMNKPIVLELDHINGIRTDNRLENLRFVCPNCHSQTKTFRGRNINKNDKKVSDEDLLIALNETNNIRQALLKVGLAPKGGNYTRAYNILNNGVSNE